MNINCSNKIIISLFTFLIFSQLLNSQNIIERSNGEMDSNHSVYYCELQSTITVNGITRFEVIQSWNKLNSLRMAFISVKDNGGLKLEDYILEEENGKNYLLLKNISKEIDALNNILIGFHFDEKRELQWSKDKLINFDSLQRVIPKETDNELVLSKTGKYVNFEYSIEGNFSCKNREIVQILIDANFNQKIFKNWFKTEVRNYFGKLTLDEIKAKSKKGLIASELKENLNNTTCFNFSKIEIKLE